VASSIAETKCIAACVAAREAMWLQKLLVGLFEQSMDPTIIHCDNQSCVKLFVNLVFHDRTKHVEIKYHYIKDMVLRKEIQLRYICTDEQTTNILTNPLSRTKFVYFRDKHGMVEIQAPIEKESQY
jgi:hypothetical protein